LFTSLHQSVRALLILRFLFFSLDKRNLYTDKPCLKVPPGASPKPSTACLDDDSFPPTTPPSSPYFWANNHPRLLEITEETSFLVKDSKTLFPGCPPELSFTPPCRPTPRNCGTLQTKHYHFFPSRSPPPKRGEPYSESGFSRSAWPTQVQITCVL